MRIGIVSVLLLAVPFLLAAEDKKPEEKKLEFKEYVSEKHGFKVNLPGDPKVANQKAGDLVLTNYMVEIDVSTVFLVTVSDYPKDTVKEDTAEKILDGARDGVVDSLKGKVVKDTEKGVTLEGATAGREAQVECPGLGTYRYRHILVGDRLYQIVVLAKEIATSKEADAYLESFKLVKE